MTQEQQALQASLRDWAKQAGTIAVTRARQDVTALMNDLAALGVFAIPQERHGHRPGRRARGARPRADSRPGPAHRARQPAPGHARRGRAHPWLADRDPPARRRAAGHRPDRPAPVVRRPAARRGRHGRRRRLVPPGPAGRYRHHALPGRLLPRAGHRPARHRHPGRVPPARPGHAARPRPGRHLVRGRSRGGGRLVQQHGGRLRRDPPPVRPADRLVPGGQAPVRHHGLPGRTRRRPRLGRRPRRRRGARPDSASPDSASPDSASPDSASRAPVRRGGRRRAGARRRGGQRQGLHPGPRRHRLHLGARRPPVPAPRPGAAPAARRYPRLAQTARRPGGHRPPKGGLGASGPAQEQGGSGGDRSPETTLPSVRGPAPRSRSTAAGPSRTASSAPPSGPRSPGASCSASPRPVPTSRRCGPGAFIQRRGMGRRVGAGC